MRHMPTIIRFTKERPERCLTGQVVATDDQRYFIVLYDPNLELTVSGDEVTNRMDITQNPFPLYHVDGAIVESEYSKEKV